MLFTIRTRLPSMDVRLRRLKASDFEALAEIFDSEDVIEHTSQVPYVTAERWAELLRGSEQCITIVADWEGRAIGKISIMPKPKQREKHVGVLAIAVHQAHHGKGIGKKLMMAALDLADNWLNLKRIELSVFTANTGAVALYKKYGFEIEGEAKHASFVKGAYRNLYYMARLKT